MDAIGRYRLSEPLGQGGMGVVYRAYDPLLERTVAVKLIGAHVLGQSETRERFFREARAAGQLAHKNIITIHDLGEENGQPFIAMEYLEGLDLQQRLGMPERLPLDARVDLAVQLCEGLEYAHAHGVVHRDVKPANIFITTAGTVKILDFGLARLMTSQVTSSNMLLGTLNYMAPEQVRGERPDHRADIFSTGVVLYELFGGRKAFEGDSFASTLYKILQEVPEPLGRIDPALPPALTRIVDRALAKPVEERYQSARELRQALEAFRRSYVPTSAGALAEDHALAGPRRRRVRTAVLAVPAIAAGIAGAWFLRADRPAPEPAPATPPAVEAAADPQPVAASPASDPPRPAAAAASPPQNGSTNPAATPADRRAAVAARTRMQEEREAARRADAAATPAYRTGARAEAEAVRLLNAGRHAEATARFYEASGLYQSAALNALARASGERPPEGAAAPQSRARGSAPGVSRPPAEPPPTQDVRTGPPDALPGVPVSAGAPAIPAPPPPAPAPAASPAPEPPPSRTSSVDEGVKEALDRYRAAFEARSFDALRRVWPGLSGAAAQAIREEFRHASRITLSIADLRITASGDTATARFTRRYEIVTVDGQRPRSESDTTVRLRRGPSGWTIESVQYVPRR